MWIRSQDKMALMNATTFRMYYSGHKTEWRIYCDQKCIAEEYTNLGTYSTKEKALKVLDMIQTHTYQTNVYEISKGDYDYRVCPLKSVFQMPQDDEV